jgi:mono/diheme cytochrome c family protein
MRPRSIRVTRFGERRLEYMAGTPRPSLLMRPLRVFAVSAVFCSACAGPQANHQAQNASDGVAGDCSAPAQTASLRPLGGTRSSGTVVLAEQGGRTLALVADEDDRALHVLDLENRKEIASVPLAGSPSQVLVASDGRVLVTLRDASQVQVFVPGPEGKDKDAAAPLVPRCTVPTPSEPIAVAESPDSSTFVVTSGWGHSLDVLRGRDLARVSRVDLPREPRGVLVSDDGHEAVVSHVLGSTVSVVDLRTAALRHVDTHGPEEERTAQVRLAASQAKKDPFSGFGNNPVTSRTSTGKRRSIQGFALAKVAGHVVGARVLVDPGELDEVPTYYGSNSRATEVADMMVLDDRLEPIDPPAATQDSPGLGRSFRSRRAPVRDDDCLLPRAVAENTADHTALVACMGTDTLVEYSIESPTGAAHAAPMSHWSVASGPTGVAYDAKHGQAVVWSQFDHTLSLVAMPTGSLEDRLVPAKDRVTRWALARPAGFTKDGDSDIGRTLFHLAGDRRLSREGLACASCHPDGRDDGLTWATSDGPRQTLMLAGRLEGTEPFAWSGTSMRVADHLEHTLQRLGGNGLGDREREAISSYCFTMKTFGAPPHADARAARGKQIFESADAGCASCHAGQGGLFTDRKKHDVGSQTLTDEQATFDTPSLRFVGGTAPYFHDGRYASLRDLLVGSSGKMGKTAQLSPEDLDSLEAYLKTL